MSIDKDGEITFPIPNLGCSIQQIIIVFTNYLKNKVFLINAVLDAELCNFLIVFCSLIDITETHFGRILTYYKLLVCYFTLVNRFL